MSWKDLKTWQKAATAVVLSMIIVVVFLYGYAFLYDYLYAKNFPQIPVTTFTTKYDPTKFSDPSASLIVEMANVLDKALS